MKLLCDQKSLDFHGKHRRADSRDRLAMPTLGGIELNGQSVGRNPDTYTCTGASRPLAGVEYNVVQVCEQAKPKNKHNNNNTKI